MTALNNEVEALETLQGINVLLKHNTTQVTVVGGSTLIIQWLLQENL